LFINIKKNIKIDYNEGNDEENLFPSDEAALQSTSDSSSQYNKDSPKRTKLLKEKEKASSCKIKTQVKLYY
jgi:hypothetical protein